MGFSTNLFSRLRGDEKTVRGRSSLSRYPDDDFLDEGDEPSARAPGRFLYFFVIQPAVCETRCPVGDAGDTQDPQSHLNGCNRLGDRRHADGIRTQGCQHPDFGGGFVAGAGNRNQDPLFQGDVQIPTCILGSSDKIGVVGSRHVRETKTEGGIVRTDQGVGEHEVDVVGDEHQITGDEDRIDSPGGVGQDEVLNPHLSEHPDGEDDFLYRISLVHVHPALDRHDGYVPGFPEDNPSPVARDGRGRPVGDVGCFDGRRVVQFVAQIPQAGSQDNGRFRTGRRAGFPEEGDGFRDLISKRHGVF